MTGEAAYATALHREFAGVAAALGRCRTDVVLAGHRVRIDVAGTALGDRLTPAFAHLLPAGPGAIGLPGHGPAGTGAPPALTIEAWDRASAGRAAPAPPWQLDQYAPRERIEGIDPRQARVAYDPGPGILSLYRPGSGRASWYAADLATVPRWVVRMPFRHLIGWWAQEVGLTFAHAAAVGRGGACILLPGRSGSGKSTTALAAAEHGLDFLGDDLCLLDVAARTAHAPFAWAKAEADAVARLPALAGRVVATEAGQSLLRPPNLVRSATIVGIALPRVAGGARTSTRPAARSEAMFALGPSTLVEGNGAGAASLALLARLVRAVPAAHLDLGTDMGGVVAAIDELVGRWAR